MRKIADWPVWIGHAGDRRDTPALTSAGIKAVVDLAANEAPGVGSRELVYCRFPMFDGVGNDEWRIRAAIDCVVALLMGGVPTLVCCGAGMSRSPAVVAAALSVASGEPLVECLAAVTRQTAVDVNGGFLVDVHNALQGDALDAEASHARRN